MADRDYSATVVKTLFALSGNTCAHQDARGLGCEEKLTDPSWGQVNAQICHICAASPKGPRYDESMSDAGRDAFENLILMCPNHSRMIDYLRPDDYTVEALREMKQHHDARGIDRASWATTEQVACYAALLMAWIPATPNDVINPTEDEATAAKVRPALTARLNPDYSLDIVNRGGGTAYGISVEPAPMGAAIPTTVAAYSTAMVPKFNLPVLESSVRLRWSDDTGSTITNSVTLRDLPGPRRRA